MLTKEFIQNEIRPAINKALAAAVLPPGITVRLGSGSFNDGEVSFKLIATAVSETGIPIMPDLEKKMIAQITGLPESRVQGLKIDIQGKEFTVTGYNGRASKNPIELRGADGREAKCPESTLINALRRAGQVTSKIPGVLYPGSTLHITL